MKKNKKKKNNKKIIKKRKKISKKIFKFKKKKIIKKKSSKKNKKLIKKKIKKPFDRIRKIKIPKFKLKKIKILNLKFKKKKTVPYNILNIGSNNPKSLKYFLKLIEKNLSKKAIIKLKKFQVGDVYKTHADNSLIETITKTKISDNINHMSRKAIVVCMTLAEILLENSLL